MLLWLTLNTYHESRGESDLTQQAVVHVVMNRSKESGDSIKSVVKEKNQFSWTRSKKKLNSKPWVTDPKGFSKCQLNVLRAIVKKDSTNGSVYFHETRVNPKWAKRKVRTVKLGKFVFYKERT